MEDPRSENGTDQEVPQDAAPDDAIAAENNATVEAILFATDSPLRPERIAQVAQLPGRREVRRAIAALNARYEEMGCAFRIEEIAGGYQMLTLPEYHDVLSALLRARGESRLTQASLETLAIVAYRQPILRADVEAIRGVACGDILRGLLDKQLVKIVGRAEVPGRPMLYGTTRRFLEVFGLASLDDLPRVEELRQAVRSAGAKLEDVTDTQPAPEQTPAPEN
ncbi:MAG TPA: SMC-Scp complex subunit ScpB [Phycisphaerae bacterium]|nr:SMC-Scp complex subunit ScpB [Phycisphaerae bacterium]